MMTVFWRACQMRESSVHMRSRVSASSEPNGSSSRSRSGSWMSARAIATRCAIPPESSRGQLDSNPPSPTSSINSRARDIASASPSSSSGSMMFSSTVRHGMRLACWKTMPIFGCCKWRKLTSPLVGGRSPATIRNSVDLPLPDGPSTATNSRGQTSNETRSSACNPPLLSGKVALRSRTVRMGEADIGITIYHLPITGVTGNW